MWQRSVGAVCRLPRWYDYIGSWSNATANWKSAGKRSAARGYISLYECLMVTSATPAISPISAQPTVTHASHSISKTFEIHQLSPVYLRKYFPAVSNTTTKSSAGSSPVMTPFHCHFALHVYCTRKHFQLFFLLISIPYNDVGRRSIIAFLWGFPPNTLARPPNPHFWGPFNAKRIIETALRSRVIGAIRSWKFTIIHYTDIGKYLCVCQNFSVRGRRTP